jgi:GABA permease
MRRYLVVANQTLAGHRLLEHVRYCLATGPSWFFVLVPATPIHMQVVPGEGEAELLARQRLAGALARFRGEGASVVGAVGDPSPLRAVSDALRQRSFDEIVLSTLPPGTSRWLVDDLPSRLARATGLPVTHLVAEDQLSPEATALRA